MNQTSTSTLSDAFQSLTPFAVFFFIVGSMAFIIAIAYMIRLWLAQTATLQIQKDIADIKEKFLENAPQGSISDMEVNQNIQPKVIKKKFEFKKPRHVFIWMSFTIPVLLTILIIIINTY